MVQGALLLGDKWSKPLYELIPDLIPQGRLTEVELELWGMYYARKKEQKANG